MLPPGPSLPPSLLVSSRRLEGIGVYTPGLMTGCDDGDGCGDGDGDVDGEGEGVGNGEGDVDGDPLMACELIDCSIAMFPGCWITCWPR
jgi:hypothetical protein